MEWDRDRVPYQLPNIEREVVRPTRDPGRQAHSARAKKQELRWNKRGHFIDAPGLANNPAAEAPRHPSSRTTGLIKGAIGQVISILHWKRAVGWLLS